MTTSLTNRFRPSVDVLEHREAPSGLTTSPFAWLDEEPRFFFGVSAAAESQARPFHAEDAGSAAFNGPIAVGTTITASATGQATHLGDFTLHDSSTIVEIVGPVLSVVEAAGTGVEWERVDVPPLEIGDTDAHLDEAVAAVERCGLGLKTRLSVPSAVSRDTVTRSASARSAAVRATSVSGSSPSEVRICRTIWAFARSQSCRRRAWW